jgi:hypothetical protein
MFDNGRWTVPYRINVSRTSRILSTKPTSNRFLGRFKMTSPKLGCYKVILLLVGMSACFFLRAHAQTESGTIRGSVTDPSGAVVPGASVRLIDDDRGLQTEVATGTGGLYTFSSVRPGHYRMEVEKNGFKLARVSAFTLNVLDNLEQSVKLDLGPVSESVTIKGSAVNVNTTDGTVTTVVDRTFADNLPLNGRSFETLIMLTPGVVVTSTAFDDQGQFSVNGQRADANYFTVDGVSANFGVTGYFPLVQNAGGAFASTQCFGRNKQSGIRECNARISRADVVVCPGIRTNPGWTDFDRNTLRNE